MMYLGIDCGTQGTKAVLHSSDGAVVSSGYAPHPIIERPTGAREQDPQWWIDAAIVAVRMAMDEAHASERNVAAIGVSGQQHGLILLDEHKTVIRCAKLWNDTETASENEEIIALLGGREACFDRLGLIPLTGYTLSKLLWVKKHEPENFARIRHILLPHEYINFWLTGNFAAEYGDSSGTAYFNIKSRAWCQETLAAVDGGSGQLAASLPKLLSCESIVGSLRPEAASILDIAEICLVSTGGGDNMMGAIGTANIVDGAVTVSLGTSSTVYSYSSQPVLDRTGQIAAFCSSSGGWLPLVCTMNATNVVTQTLHLFGRTVGDIEIALADTAPGADGLCVLPFLNGERTPDLPNARGSLHGISSTNYTAENIIRATIEGVSFGILAGLDLILAGRKADRIVIIGGGARSREWCQLLSDASGIEIAFPVQGEAGCLGAAMQARYAERYHAGQPETFAQIAQTWVRMNEALTIYPRLELRAKYDIARKLYRDTLGQQFSRQ